MGHGFSTTPHGKDFVQKVLWRKLNVHERVHEHSSTDISPVCGQKESIKHATMDCSMCHAVSAVVQHCYGAVDVDGNEMSVHDTIELANQEWSL